MHVHQIEAEDLMNRLIANASSGGHTHHVVTANAQFYNLAEKQMDFRACLYRAEYVCADGVSVVLACRWLGGKQVHRIAGVDLLERLCVKATHSGLSVFFLGGNEGSAEMAAAALARKYPGFQAAGISCPPRGFEKDEKSLLPVLRMIKDSAPSIVFVALGAPRQELFIQEYIRPLHVPVAIGVGGSFEIIGGRRHRAPKWVQHIGLEWLYRWAQEPIRLTPRFLLGNTLFCFYLLRYLLRGKAN